MIKALFAGSGIAVLFFFVYFFDIYDFLASRMFFWGAVLFFIVMMIGAGIVLGVPFTKEDRKEDRKSVV